MRVRHLVIAALLSAVPAPAFACPPLLWSTPVQLAPRHGLQAPLGAVMYGYVRTVAGKPVAGAVVEARPLSAGGVADHAVTDGNGVYVLSHLVPSSIALTVTARGMERLGPLPYQVPEGERHQPRTLRFDIGGMGPRVPEVPPLRDGGSLADHVFKLPGVTRKLIDDGRGGVDALELKSLATLSWRGSHLGLSFGAMVLGASWEKGPTRRLYTISGDMGSGSLTAYGSGGRELWCRALPFSPTDVAAGRDGTAWVVGAQDGFGVAAIVSGAGSLVRSIALSPGSILRVATDAAGDAWIADRQAGLVRLDAHGNVKARIFLPETPYLLEPTPDGGLWAIGGGVATRIDAHQRLIARVVRPQPIDMATVDGQGRLWILQGGKLMAFAPHWARSYELAGLPIQGATGLAVDRHRDLWLLGLDRQRLAVARVP